MLTVSTVGFNGPMDLLLALIDKEKIDIEAIEISSITEKYLKELESLKKLNREDLSDFIEMASTLMLIKSSRILPKNEYIEPEEITEEELKRRLKEYRKYKKISVYLSQMEQEAMKFFTKTQEDISAYSSERFEVIQSDPTFLTQAILDLLNQELRKFENTSIGIIELEDYPVEKYIEDIQFEMRENRVYSMREFLVRDGSKLELITVFLSILELVKSKWIHVIQNEDDILVRQRL